MLSICTLRQKRPGAVSRGPGFTTDLGAILGMTLRVLLYTLLDWTTLGFLLLLSV